MRGRWAAGIVPRNFNWVIRDHLAISERPGGYAPTHRRVRRQEEILWLRGHGFTRVVSLLPSSHNLHAYSELGVTWSHFPLPLDGDLGTLIAELYPQLAAWMRSGERILIHQDELSDLVMGIAAGFLRWSGLLPAGPEAITALEQIVRRQMGSPGRAIVALLDTVSIGEPAPSNEPDEAAAQDAPVTPLDVDHDDRGEAAGPSKPPSAQGSGETKSPKTASKKSSRPTH